MSRAQADAVALAVDNPKREWDGWPWPYANRPASYKPSKFVPHPLGPEPDAMWPYVVACFVALACFAFVACAYWWRA